MGNPKYLYTNSVTPFKHQIGHMA